MRTRESRRSLHSAAWRVARRLADAPRPAPQRPKIFPALRISLAPRVPMALRRPKQRARCTRALGAIASCNGLLQLKD